MVSRITGLCVCVSHLLWGNCVLSNFHRLNNVCINTCNSKAHKLFVENIFDLEIKPSLDAHVVVVIVSKHTTFSICRDVCSERCGGANSFMGDKQ